MNDKWEEGIVAGRAAFAAVNARGSKFKSRRIPVFIRENLMTPYYITCNENQEFLWVMVCPNDAFGKVGFKQYARRMANETTEISQNPKPQSSSDG